jgi:hypothetical protein
LNKMVTTIVLSALLTLPGLAGAMSENDFRADTTEQIVSLCTANPDDPLSQQAVNFCQGYLVGAYKYYEAAHSGPNAPKFVCLPNPAPSRDETIRMFIGWAKAHPQYMKESPVETEFRFLMEKWSCIP